MMPNVTRGGRTAGLMVYLFGKGRSNEHTDQHIVAGDAGAVREFAGREVTNDLVLDIANYLDAPMKLHGVTVTAPDKRWDPELGKDVSVGSKPGHIWHCSLSLNASEGPLDDEKWASIARDFVHEMGFDSSELGDDDDVAGCRWVAVRHGVSKAGNDHVHIAVNLVREDGTKASVHNDFRRAQTAANTLERRYGLQVLASREEGLQLPQGTKPAELDRAQRSGRAPERDELRRRLRSVVASATSESDFLTRARQERVLIRPRYARGDSGKVAGCSVALVPQIGPDGRRGPLVWFSPSKLDSNLGLGQLRARWGSTTESEAAALPLWKERHEAARSGKAEAGSRRRPERLPADLVQRLNASGQNVVPDRAGGFDRYASIDLSIAFARASEYFERGEHGPFAVASDVFARAGARERATPTNPQRGRRADAALHASAAYQARLMARGVGRNSASGWLAVFRQMQRTAKALQRQSEASGRAQHALAMRAAMANAERSFEQVITAQRSTSGAAPVARQARPGQVPGQSQERE